MKRVALYSRVSTADQHPETQLHDLRQMARQRGLKIVAEYTDGTRSAGQRRSAPASINSWSTRPAASST
jgi:DNA invertase Pin-like site-specific DNA recombinase